MIEKIKKIAQLKNLPDETLKKLVVGLTYKEFKANQIIYFVGEPAQSCFIIDYGAVKLIKPTEVGKDIIMRFCSAGEIVGAVVLKKENATFPVTSQTIEKTGAIFIPRSTYLSIWEKIPEVANFLNTTVVGRLLEFQEDKAQFPAPVAKKIGILLLNLLESKGDKICTINIKLSRKDLAERVGTTVETVIRVMSQWTNKGWIKTEDQKITINNREALENFVQSID